MFNNGKFKNVVADSDTNSPVDRTVPPGGALNATIVLKPQRGESFYYRHTNSESVT